MFNDNFTMWLPGLEPANVVEAPISAPQKPIAIEVQQYVREKSRSVWPPVRQDLWDRSFTPVERFQMNLDALKAVQSLNPGDKPDMKTVETISLFTGWGALSKVFAPEGNGWDGRQKELVSVLGDDFKSAQQAVTTSFFTPPSIIRSLWSGLRRLGFKGGKVLEPSAGSGMFLASMPDELAKHSQLTAVELDQSAASVLAGLYGPYGVKVINKGFEKASLPESYFDLVVTNVPFGDFGVPETRSVPFRDFRIHDYFIAKAMEVVRPGGLVAVITSSGTMDKVSTTVRQYLGMKGRLVSAIRLPNSAFKAFAGTEPMTDILIFQRYEASDVLELPEGCGWNESLQAAKGHPALGGHELHFGAKLLCNQWFLDRPEQILGRLTLEASNGYRQVSSCVEGDGGYQSQLDRLMGELPEGTFKSLNGQSAKKRSKGLVMPGGCDVPAGTFMVVNDRVAVSEDGEKVIIEDTLSAKAVERIRGMIAVRDAAKALIDAQVSYADDVEPMRLRAVLNEVYDRFVKAMGSLNSQANTRAFNGDPSAALLCSLELVEIDGSVRKSEIFTRRTVGYVAEITHCDTAEDAMLASLSKVGRLDVGLMASLTGMTEDDLIDDLSCKGAMYLNPSNKKWEPADQYLSGDVKTKLAMCELEGPEFAGNIAALKEVIPRDLLPSDISARLGSTWIPLSEYQAFVAEVLQFRGEPRVSYEALSGSWSVSGQGYEIPVDIRQKFGTTRSEVLSLFEQALNQQVPTVTDADPLDGKKRVVNQVDTIAAREKQSDLKERFTQWLWEDEKRAGNLALKYNETFNRTVERVFNGKHLALPGFSNLYQLHQHQLDAIWRIVAGGRNTLLAHCVGAGKTLEMICAGQELKRLGIATKPCYVVPNHMLKQFSNEFMLAYPGANILIASKDDLAGNRRRRFLSRIATNNWDAVVITHATYERIKLADETVKSYIEVELAQLTAAAKIENEAGNRMTVKQLERAKRIWEARLEKIVNGKGDEELSLTFEDLGLDWLMVDEAHAFKNLFRFTKMARVSGLPNSNAERSFDMYLKTTLVSQLHGNKGGVTFATGTPVSNSMAELWTMQRYLQRQTLEGHGMGMFDAWAANFGESVAAIEIAPDGSGYRMNTRFSRFTNLPELMAIFREVADIKTAEMIKLNVPVVSKEIQAAKASPKLRAYVEQLVKRSEVVRNGGVSPKVDNMLAITNDGRKAALDMRLLEPSFGDDPNSKVNLCVKEVLEIYRATCEDRLTQVIFSDLGTPNSSSGSFSVYGDIKRKLIAAGVPAREVGFAHDAKNDNQKEALAKAVRQGTMRIVLGSSQKLGVGTNMQDRLTALHHLDAPWRPADIEQREGRIVRQGNTNKAVRIIRYVTENSFDAYIWQTLETKARFIAQIMSGDTGMRSAEDLELTALSYAEVKALASGNPLVIEKAGVDAEVAKLSIMKSEHNKQQWSNRRELTYLPKYISAAKQQLVAHEIDLEAVKAVQGVSLKVGGQVISDRKAVGQMIETTVEKNVFRGGREVVVGKIGDFTVTVEAQMLGKGYKIRLRNASVYEAGFTGGALSALHNLDGLLKDVLEARATYVKRIEYLSRQEIVFRSQLDAPFDKADRLEQLLERQSNINKSLGIDDGVLMATEAA